MAFEEKDEAVIRSYLLGELSEDDLVALEQRVMSDNEFSERVLMIEDSIVEDYIDARLKGRARESFEKLLLSTPQGAEQLRFTRALKDYASKAKASEPVVETGRGWWKSGVWALRWAPVGAVIVLAAVGVATWRTYFAESELNKGLAAMNRAFERQRPIDARITVLGYAVRPNTRGNVPETTDPLALRQAEIILPDNAAKRPGAASFHALGCLYLAEGDLDTAIDTLNQALTSDPTSALIHSDLGAAHLELPSMSR